MKFYIKQQILNSYFQKELARSLAHGSVGGLTSMAQGGKFKHGFFAGSFASMAGSGMQASGWGVFQTQVGGGIAAAVVGGTASELGGGKFANGAVTGAYTMLFNHMAHGSEDQPKAGSGRGTISLLGGAADQDFSGFWGGAKYFWTGGNIDGYHYNLDGKATGLAPMMGVAPTGKLGTYAKLAKMTRGFKGAIQAHHLVEVRHLRRLMMSSKNAPSVILSRADHAAMTKTLQHLLPYGQTYTKPQLLNAYRQAYSMYPEWVDLVVKFLH